MQNILVIAPNRKEGPASVMIPSLKAAGYALAYTSMDGGSSDIDLLCKAFEGRPPDVLLADLTTAPDCLPMRYAHRLLKQTWGDDMPIPASLVLLAPHHLALPDWLLNTDDFLLPPYAPKEALKRIELLLFRKRNVKSHETLVVADVTLDLSSGSAADNTGRSLPLTPREYDLLRFLSTHRGKFFARDRLLDMVWGIEFEGGERTVDIHIRRLRAKLPPQVADLLETRRGIGYGLRGSHH